MSGAVSGAQFSFVPHTNTGLGGGDGEEARPSALKDWMAKPSHYGGAAAGSEFKGIRTLTPIASGAFSSQDQAMAFRHTGENVLGGGRKNFGSWLFKPED